MLCKITRTLKRALSRAALLLCGAVMMGGCANLETVAPPVNTLTGRGKDTASLEGGRRIYLENCTRCHVPEPVQKFCSARWPGIIEDMGARSHLSAEQHRAVLAYVLAASQPR